MLHVYNYDLLKMSTWCSKHVEENSILWINNNQCIKLVINVYVMTSFVKIRKWKSQHTAAWDLWVSWKSVGVKAALYFEESIKFWPSFLHPSTNLHEVCHKRCLKKHILWRSVAVRRAHSLRCYTAYTLLATFAVPSRMTCDASDLHITLLTCWWPGQAGLFLWAE